MASSEATSSGAQPNRFRFQRSQFPDLGGPEWVGVYDENEKPEVLQLLDTICEAILKITPGALPNHNDVKMDWRAGYIWRPVCHDNSIRREWDTFDGQIDDSDGTRQGAAELPIPTIVLPDGFAATLSKAFKDGRIRFHKGGRTEEFNKLMNKGGPV